MLIFSSAMVAFIIVTLTMLFYILFYFKINKTNSIIEQVDVEPVPTGPDNPYGNAFKTKETTLHSVATAKRLIAPEKARIWKIKNPHVLNKVQTALFTN
jgi:primary-amine oxidase